MLKDRISKSGEMQKKACKTKGLFEGGARLLTPTFHWLSENRLLQAFPGWDYFGVDFIKGGRSTIPC